MVGAGAADAVVCEHHAYGGAGAANLGEAVISACQQKVDFKFLYDSQQPIKVSIASFCMLSLPGSVTSSAWLGHQLLQQCATHNQLEAGVHAGVLHVSFCRTHPAQYSCFHMCTCNFMLRTS